MLPLLHLELIDQRSAMLSRSLNVLLEAVQSVSNRLYPLERNLPTYKVYLAAKRVLVLEEVEHCAVGVWTLLSSLVAVVRDLFLACRHVHARGMVSYRTRVEYYFGAETTEIPPLQLCHLISLGNRFPLSSQLQATTRTGTLVSSYRGSVNW
jgi:hypothetical protein